MIKPLSDVVVIRRSAPQAVSDGGIHLVFDEDHKEDIGVVAYAGPGKAHGCKHCGTHEVSPVPVKAGDTVLFSTNGHQITTINGEEFVILRQGSLIGVIE